jgi:endoglucanase
MRSSCTEPGGGQPRPATCAALLLALTVFVTVSPATVRAQATQAPHEAAMANKPLLNQLGFKPGWGIHVFVASTQRDNRPLRATATCAAGGITLIETGFGPPREDQASGDWIRVLDLGAAWRPGRYLLNIADAAGVPFTVNEDAYQALLRALLRSFYLQRCGLALNDAETGLSHGVCHAQDGTLAHADEINPQGQVQAAAGGWHDAGDYGKYVATTAVAIGRILAAYERAPARFADDASGIPESGNGIPDLLDEMRVGLDWMLAMQRVDGAVYRKLGGAQWPKGKAPDQDTDRRFVYGVSSPETAKAAAAWAQAARLYRGVAPAQAARYLAAARRSWQWLSTLTGAQRIDLHPDDDSGSGPYVANKVDAEASLLHDRDDRLWAATELYLSTGEAAFLRVMEQLLPNTPLNLYEWKDPSALALSYLLWHPALKNQATLAALARPHFLQRAQGLLDGLGHSGWRIANPRFVWGSNKMTIEEGITLCQAYRIDRNPQYLTAARDQLHYVLGRNHFGKSFVSGIGSDPVGHVSHLWFQVSKRPIPGLLVGGPNSAEQSNIAPRGQGPLSWVDDTRSYATNEFAVDYNASLIGLLASLETDCDTRGDAP